MGGKGLRSRALAGALATAVLGGCTHTVVGPSGVARSTPVFLLDHGRTSSLVLPRGDRLVRYSYGEWDWYAHGRTGVLRGSGALLSDTRAAIGRRTFRADARLAAVRAAVEVPIQSAWVIEVPADRARTLEAELDALFRDQAAEAVHNPRVALHFVPHPAPYSLGHNSNHMTASWLRRLECRVDVNGPLSRWRVIDPERRPGRAPR